MGLKRYRRKISKVAKVVTAPMATLSKAAVSVAKDPKKLLGAAVIGGSIFFGGAPLAFAKPLMAKAKSFKFADVLTKAKGGLGGILGKIGLGGRPQAVQEAQPETVVTDPYAAQQMSAQATAQPLSRFMRWLMPWRANV